MAIGNPSIIDSDDSFVIAAGQSLSSVVNLKDEPSAMLDSRGDSAVAIYLPPNFAGSQVTFLSAPTKDGPYYPVYLSGDTLYAVKVGPQRCVILDAHVFYAIRYIKMVSSEPQTVSVNVPINSRPI